MKTLENKSVLNLTLLESVISDNKTYVEEDGRTTKEYHLDDFDSYPEGWDSVFLNCPSWDELTDIEREERREVLKDALKNY